MEDSKYVRLNKYLAECGICSRREADKLIAAGKVQINGRMAEMGDRTDGTDEITAGGKAVRSRQDKVVLAYYKEVGVTCTEKDAHAKKIIKDVLDYPVRVTYAGRLDKDSEGLLLMTNDGGLEQAMMKASNHHEKEYVVKLNKKPDQAFLEAMRSGMYLPELGVRTRPCRIEQTGDYTVNVILTQGLNRQIRRMCTQLGYRIRSLKRIRVLNITLGSLRPGQYRELKGKELEELYREAGRKQDAGQT